MCSGCYRVTFFFFSSRRRHTRFDCDWSSDVCSSDLGVSHAAPSTSASDPSFAWRASAPRIAARETLRFTLTAKLRIVGGKATPPPVQRSEERRVGKECRSRWSPDHLKKKKESVDQES